MSVRFFHCKGCGEEASEYDEITCESCGNSLCSCTIPEELQEYLSCWDEVWRYIDTEYIEEKDEYRVIARNGNEGKLPLFGKYLSYSNDYGLALREKYCPICKKRKEDEKDPEYKEYLRLKEKFENVR